jgi:mannose-6-phosphate isomerase-like protein (cupin superfamily)
MIKRKLSDCHEIIAADKSRLREILHPERDYRFPGRYSLAHAIVPPKQKTLMHCLNSDEVYFILSGKGRVHIDDETTDVSANDTVEIPAHAQQWIENLTDEDLVFLCIVDPAWRLEDEKVLE